MSANTRAPWRGEDAPRWNDTSDGKVMAVCVHDADGRYIADVHGLVGEGEQPMRERAALILAAPLLLAACKALVDACRPPRWVKNDPRPWAPGQVVIDDAIAAIRAADYEATVESCARADIGNDCRCRACVERRVEQAEWTMGASREAATDALLREREGR